MGTVNGVVYPVIISVETQGDAAGAGASRGLDGIDKLVKAQERLKDGASDLVGSYIDFGKGATGAFSGVMDSAVDLSTTMLKVGGAAVFGAVTVGVVGLNKELENTKIAIGSILETQGFAPDITKGLDQAGGILTKMRKDAADLPGEFSDLLAIFRTIATPSSNAGMSVARIEAMSAKAMAAGAVMQLPSAMVGRELAMAMDGRVGAHNVFATRLGIQGGEATKFKALDAGKRADYIEEKLGHYKGAIDAFSNSYEAASSQAVDTGKKLLGDATLPLFDRVKGELRDINAWFTANEKVVDHWAGEVGNYLVLAFDKGKEIILEYGPLIRDFALAGFERLKATWEEIKPIAASIGESIKSALKDPGTLDKITHALELYAMIKVGGGAIGAANGIFGGVMSAGSALGFAGAGVADAAGMVNAGSGLGGFANGAAAVGGADIAGIEGLAAKAGGAAVSLGALAVAAVSAGLVFTAINDWRDAAKEAERMHKDEIAASVKMVAAWTNANGDIDTSSQMFKDSLDRMTEGASLFTRFLQASGQLGPGTVKERVQEEMEIEAEKQRREAAFERMRARGTNLFDEVANPIDYFASHKAAAAAARDANRKGNKGPPAGSGVTNITVYQTISSNQAPGQIARTVVDMLALKARNPTGSRGAVNILSGRK